jgi:hypothetical protein
MSAAPHAKAPWRYQLGDHKHACHGQIFDADGNLLVLRAVVNDEDAATMLLLSAAPKLLAALDALVWQIERDDGIEWEEDSPAAEMVRQARIAIAEARGGAA